jgi:hypothetical protein
MSALPLIPEVHDDTSAGSLVQRAGDDMPSGDGVLGLKKCYKKALAKSGVKSKKLAIKFIPA